MVGGVGELKCFDACEAKLLEEYLQYKRSLLPTVLSGPPPPTGDTLYAEECCIRLK